MEQKSPRVNFNKLNSLLNWPLIGKVALAAMSYLFILVIFPLIFGRKNQFIAFHARQGLILLIIWAIGLFSFYLPLLPWLVALLVLVLVIVGITNTIMQKERALPIIGRLSI